MASSWKVVNNQNLYIEALITLYLLRSLCTMCSREPKSDFTAITNMTVQTGYFRNTSLGRSMLQDPQLSVPVLASHPHPLPIKRFSRLFTNIPSISKARLSRTLMYDICVFTSRNVYEFQPRQSKQYVAFFCF